MIARKSFGPLPAHRLAWRHVSPYSSDHHSSSGSSLDASPAHAICYPTPDQSLSRYSSPTTTIDDSPAPPRFVYPPIVTLRDSEAYIIGGLPHCLPCVHQLYLSRHLDIHLLSHMRGHLARGRFVLIEESIEEDIDDGVGIEVDTHIVMGVEVAREDRIGDIEAGQRQLEAGRMISDREKASMSESIEVYKANRNLGIRNGNDGGDNDNGNGNGNGRGNGNGNHNDNDTCVRPVARECTYQNFMKCQPLNFQGTKGVVGLIRWFEKMETMLYISNCLEKYQVKYATCTLLNSALTWWNLHKRIIEVDVVFAMSWRELMKLMTKEYCPKNEIQKMETEL
ncbi:hypothetical protein Tco_0640677 [Tanacetum coccineum]